MDKLLAQMQKKIQNNKMFFDKIKKLREKTKTGKDQKYRNVLNELKSQDYTFTNELFSTWGAKHFANEIAAGNFVSADIPTILKDLFGFDLTQKVNDYVVI